MPNKDLLKEALTAFMGDESAANEILDNADEVSRQNRARNVIMRKNDSEANEEVEDVEIEGTEVVEEDADVVEGDEEEVEVEETIQVELVEFELTDENVAEIAEAVRGLLNIDSLVSELKTLRNLVAELAEDDNDDVPARKRKVVRPTRRGKQEETPVESDTTEDEDGEGASLSGTDVAERRKEILRKLRNERKQEVKKID